MQRFRQPKRVLIHFSDAFEDTALATGVKRTHAYDRSRYSCLWNGTWREILHDQRGHYIQCGFRLPYVLKKALEETALQRGVTESELVRQILSGELCVADMPEPMIGGDRRSASFNSDLSP